MDIKVKFFFWLASVVVLALGAFEPVSRRPLRTRLAPVPLGLALFVIPFMWDAGVQAF